MIIRANFSSGGLTANMPCVYLLMLRNAGESWQYVGRTGTSNNTGTSPPYKRLAKHLAKAGKTQSCIWDSSKRLPKRFLNNASLSFVALPLKKKDVEQAEQWMRWRFKGAYSLNKQTPRERPSIKKGLQLQLQGTFGSFAPKFHKG
jgi:hypothetical protein